MKGKLYSIHLGDRAIPVRIRYPQTTALLQGYLEGPFPENQESEGQVFLAEFEENIIRNYYPPAYLPYAAEGEILAVLLSEALLDHSCMIFHSVSLVWEGKAWLFAGPSGVGKTTHYRNWKSLFREEIRILNGDKPILEYRPGGEIYVWPSPWKGKEGFGEDVPPCPLGGIILLEQGPVNRMERLSQAEALDPAFLQCHAFMRDEKTILAVCALLDKVLKTVPFWRLQNCGDQASAALARSVLLDYLQEGAI